MVRNQNKWNKDEKKVVFQYPFYKEWYITPNNFIAENIFESA